MKQKRWSRGEELSLISLATTELPEKPIHWLGVSSDLNRMYHNERTEASCKTRYVSIFDRHRVRYRWHPEVGQGKDPLVQAFCKTADLAQSFFRKPMRQCTAEQINSLLCWKLFNFCESGIMKLETARALRQFALIDPRVALVAAMHLAAADNVGGIP